MVPSVLRLCCTLPQVIASNTADAETRQKAAQEKEESLKEQSAQIAVSWLDKEPLEGSTCFRLVFLGPLHPQAS